MTLINAAKRKNGIYVEPVLDSVQSKRTSKRVGMLSLIRYLPTKEEISAVTGSGVAKSKIVLFISLYLVV